MATLPPSFTCRDIAPPTSSDDPCKGFATEAVRACLKRAFQAYDMPAIVSFCVNTNSASGAVMQRVGFQREGESDHPAIAPATHPIFSTTSSIAPNGRLAVPRPERAPSLKGGRAALVIRLRLDTGRPLPIRRPLPPRTRHSCPAPRLSRSERRRSAVRRWRKRAAAARSCVRSISARRSSSPRPWPCQLFLGPLP